MSSLKSISTVLSIFALLFMLASISEGKSKIVKCKIVYRVQTIVPDGCDTQNIKIPICFGFCPTSEKLFINGVDITRNVDSPSPSCSCCRPVSYKKIREKVLCYRRTLKEITLTVPTDCECETTCSTQEPDKEKLNVERKDHWTGPDGMMQSKKALYNILGKA